MPVDATFRPGDAVDLQRRGIPREEAERQLELLRRGAVSLSLLRPCVVGDGIDVLDAASQTELIEIQRRAATAGRFHKFVPASGAATRMFADLLYFHLGPGAALEWSELQHPDASEPEFRALRRFIERLPEFPFRSALRDSLREQGHVTADLVARGEFRTILAALFGSGLGYDNLPKAVLPFHIGPEGARTPLDEHLVEAAQTTRDHDGVCRLHFTVSPEHRSVLLERFNRQRRIFEGEFAARFVLETSEQRGSTDTIAMELDGAPARTPDGSLLLRPGGHGSLIENLQDLDADLVYVKNIDNVQPDAGRADTLQWKRVIGGVLVDIQGQAFGWIHRLRASTDDAAIRREAAGFVRERFGVDLPASTSTAQLLDRLDRPIRVCGVVRNTGEPGGGPYWVQEPDGRPSRQIVEMAQVDLDQPAQRAAVEGATHFNPVDLVCSLRDPAGQGYDLGRFIDRDACFVSTKSVDGRTIRVLERPGLWNGAMGGWNTVFVEVPLTTFTPVKTVFDLLRPEHTVRNA